MRMARDWGFVGSVLKVVPVDSTMKGVDTPSSLADRMDRGENVYDVVPRGTVSTSLVPSS